MGRLRVVMLLRAGKAGVTPCQQGLRVWQRLGVAVKAQQRAWRRAQRQPGGGVRGSGEQRRVEGSLATQLHAEESAAAAQPLPFEQRRAVLRGLVQAVQPEAPVRRVQAATAIAVTVPYAGFRGLHGAAWRELELHTQRACGGFFRAIDVGPGQTVLAMQRGGRCRLRQQQALIKARLFPVAGLAVRAEDTQVEACDGLPVQLGQQGCAMGQVQARRCDACGLHDGRLHQGERDGSRGVEDLPFVLDVVADVLVLRGHAQLLLAAQHQDRSAVQHQRPEGTQFGFAERIERMVGRHGREDAQRIAFGMVQQRGTGHGQVGDTPGAHQIAEVDDALELPLALFIAGPNGVVIGDVQVHGLGWQLRRQWRQALAGQARGLLDAGPLRCVLQHRQQVFDQALGVLWVPLQGARESWVVEVDQGFVEPCTQCAELRHQVRGHVLEPGQRLAVDVVEQAYPQRLAVDVQGQQGLPVVGRAHGRYGQALLAQIGQGRMLRLQLGLGIAAMAGLEHETSLRRVQAQVQVLLAAQRREAASQAVMRVQQRLGLGFAERRAGQA
ncbi:hypothetical protein D3C79_538450 [compost metagenome]